MIAIIDYGMGNLRSVQKAFHGLGYQAQLVSDPSLVPSAKGIVLPGVGAFGKAMENLTKAGFKQALIEQAELGKPFLGICLGLQLLFTDSEESFGKANETGLNIVPGTVRRFPTGVKVPQIGWNQLAFRRSSRLFAGVPKGSYVYFVHSFFVDPCDPKVVITTTDYGTEFVSSIGQGNVYGIQFHPEKSSAIGLRILKNFGEIAYANNSSH